MALRDEGVMSVNAGAWFLPGLLVVVIAALLYAGRHTYRMIGDREPASGPSRSSDG
jgi:hypothetical protein